MMNLRGIKFLGLNGAFAAGLTVFAGLLGTAHPAQAGLGELANLLRSPVGRYLMLETQEGLLLTSQLLERTTVEATDATLDELLARLSQNDMVKGAAEIEGRLALSKERFSILSAIEPHTTSIDLIEKIAGDSLAMQKTQEGFFAFVAKGEPESFKFERESFIKGEHKSLAGRDLSGRIMDAGANFSVEDLRFADLSNVSAPGVQARNADMSGADLTGFMGVQGDFTGAQMQNTRLSGARLRGANMSKAKLINADFGDAQVSELDLRGADLRGAKLGKVDAEPLFLRRGVDMKLKGALFDEKTTLPFKKAEALRLGMIFVPQ
jgi:uncharacterized protein YjbI with pentapeptide repeats